MNKECLAVGIDVGKEELVVATGETRGRVFGTSPGEIRRLYRWLHQLAGARTLQVGMEATGVYSTKVALGLKAYGDLMISVINPAQIKAHSRALLKRTKTDTVDAQVIQDFVLKHNPPTLDPAQRDAATFVRSGSSSGRAQRRTATLAESSLDPSRRRRCPGRNPPVHYRHAQSAATATGQN